MNIEIISIPDCPNHRVPVERVKAILFSESLVADIREVLVGSVSEAHALRFFGSPTVRVNSQDVEPQSHMQMGLSCRLYGNGSGVPPEELLKQAITSAWLNEQHT